MIKKVTLTTALVAVGVMTSLGYAAVAQTNRAIERTNSTDQPAIQPSRSIERTNSTDQPATQPNQSRVSAIDRTFMLKAAQGGMAEVELSQVASRRAASNDVKQYAQQMIQDHTQANDTLSQLAQQKGVTLPTKTDAQHQKLKAQLQQMSGRSFDRAYMQAMETDHAKTVALFQSQATQGQDPDLKAFAANLLPKIQQHWTMARSMTGNPAARNPNSPNSSTSPR